LFNFLCLFFYVCLSNFFFSPPRAKKPRDGKKKKWLKQPYKNKHKKLTHE